MSRPRQTSSSACFSFNPKRIWVSETRLCLICPVCLSNAVPRSFAPHSLAVSPPTSPAHPPFISSSISLSPSSISLFSQHALPPLSVHISLLLLYRYPRISPSTFPFHYLVPFLFSPLFASPEPCTNYCSSSVLVAMLLHQI